MNCVKALTSMYMKEIKGVQLLCKQVSNHFDIFALLHMLQ